MTTEFPQKPRRDDPQAPFVVQQNLDYLRDVVDALDSGIVQGQALIPALATFVDVVPGTNFSTYVAFPIPLANPGGFVWVSNKVSSGFRINCSVAAPVGGLAFDYLLKGA